MAADWILVFGTTARCCSCSGCDQLVAALSSSFASIRIHVTTDVEQCRPEDLALVVVQSCSLDELSESTQRLRQCQINAPVLGILCGLNGQEEVALPLLRELDDYICCPFPRAEFILRVRRLLTSAVEVEVPQQWRQDERLRDVIGDSSALQQVIAKIPILASCDTTCLLQGETGTGKELFARAIHYMGPRRDKPFVPVNCGAIPDHLIENELFGHAKGAYTDAFSDEPGLLACAEDGTLFLDEVDALSRSAQVKLLRLLQEHEYRQVGSSRILKSNARIIAASNSDLRKAVDGKEFREDLYHRLNILHLFIPALRERAEDIPTLARYFLLRYAEKYQKNARHLAASALRKLSAYSWPGNVRELEGVIQRAVLMSSGTQIFSGDIELPVAMVPESDTLLLSLRVAKAKMVQEFERSYLVEVLTACDGNISHAARTAGKERRSFQRLLRKYNIDIEQFRKQHSIANTQHPAH
jgi:two-component system, NtrC family, response regulator GlrR